VESVTVKPTSARCPITRLEDGEVFFEVESVPVHCNVLCSDRESALATPRGAIRLAFFRSSGMIFNVAFDAAAMAYDQAYDNNLHHSPQFRDFAAELVEDLVAVHGLRGKTVVEIGCGKGQFLELLCRAGGNRGFGFDRSYEGPERRTDVDLTFVRDWYGERYAHVAADFVCSQHVLEHIEEPNAFFEQIRLALGGRTNATVYCEVPNALWTLRDLGVWDVIYEHCSYFTAPSLSIAFERNGFEVLRARELFGAQFLAVEARPSPRATQKDRSAEIADVGRLARDLGARYRAKVDEWNGILSGIRRARRCAVVWGAGSKGVTFLNSLAEADVVESIVDLNPNKQGRFVPGTAQAIIGPEALRARRPDLVILMNPNYRSEVAAMLAKLGVETELRVV
jgi:SAM-dependent methyltransferase